MRTSPVYLAIACSLGLSPMIFAQNNAPTTTPSTTAVDSHQSPAAPQVRDIQDLLSKTVDAMLSKGDFDTVVTSLDSSTRNRIGKVNDQAWSDLDGRVDEFRKDWQSRYGQDFKLVDKEPFVFSDQHLHLNTAPAANETDAAPRTASQQQLPTTQPGGPGLSELSKTAVGELQSAQGGSPLRLQLVNEGSMINAWRIRLPDNLTAQQLHENLLDRLTAIDQQKANWPSDVNMAYEMVSHQMLAALIGAEIPHNHHGNLAPATQAGQ